MPWPTVLRSSVMAMLVGGFFASGAAAAAAPSSYEMTLIGNLVGTGDGQFDSYLEVRPIGLNNNGDVVALALSSESENALMPFTYVDGKVRRLGKEKLASDVKGINSAGEIVGSTAHVGAAYGDSTPVVWRDRTAVPLPSLGDGTAFPTSLNEHGAIVGNNVSVDYNPTAVIWIDDEITGLGTLGGAYSQATDVNDHNVVVGYAADGVRQGAYPVYWTNGTITELPVPEGTSGEALAINDRGTIVGDYHTEEYLSSAARWIDGSLETLPGLEPGGAATPYGINSDGLIVGWSELSGAPGGQTAVLWGANGDPVNLQALVPEGAQFSMSSAVAINDAGQILIAAYDRNIREVALLLTPAEPSGRHNATLDAVADATLRRLT